MPSYSTSVDQLIPLDSVDVNPLNPRQDYREIEALADNIRQFGLLQPITVRSLGDRYELIGGHRRRMAYLMLREHEPDDPSWQSIPAVIRDADDEQAFLMLLSSQLHTRNWSPREEAAALERLMHEDGMTLKQAGAQLNRTEAWMSKRLRVYADSVLSGYVQSGTLPAATAEEFISIVDPKTRKKLADQAVKQAWSKEEARKHARRLRITRQVGELERLTRNLLDALASMDPEQVPLDLFRDLQTLRGRVEMLADQRQPVTPVRKTRRKLPVKPLAS